MSLQSGDLSSLQLRNISSRWHSFNRPALSTWCPQVCHKKTACLVLSTPCCLPKPSVQINSLLRILPGFLFPLAPNPNSSTYLTCSTFQSLLAAPHCFPLPRPHIALKLMTPQVPFSEPLPFLRKWDFDNPKDATSYKLCSSERYLTPLSPCFLVC